MKKISYQSLRKFNLIMTAFHAVQGLLVLTLSSNFQLPVLGNYLQFSEASQSLTSTSQVLFQMPFALLVASFFLISSVFHLAIATIYNDTYVKNLKLGINKARWYEYSLSASIMMVAIAMLVGVYDIGSLIALFALTSVMNLMGLVMEVHNQTTKQTSWLSFVIGSLAGAVPWIIIALYFWLGASNGHAAPTFVYWIFVSIFLFFNSFAINMWLQYKQIGRWKQYLYGEHVYMVLSLLAKSALAWQVYAGTLQP